ncbi:hypothetical protein J7L85_00570 [candidate division WOR-3 bacterium]|nr:hypothetical protein [candidate division WOR-3 bacterium]
MKEVRMIVLEERKTGYKSWFNKFELIIEKEFKEKMEGKSLTDLYPSESRIDKAGNYHFIYKVYMASKKKMERLYEEIKERASNLLKEEVK